jgi:3-oxoacyl-(acyl-carrier-protein) synthase
MRQVYADAGCPPPEVDYVEAHGTGTPLGDPLLIDSVKSHLGHLQQLDNRRGPRARPAVVPAVVRTRAAGIAPRSGSTCSPRWAEPERAA